MTDDQLSTADEYDHDIPITADREAELLDKTPTKSDEFPDPPQSQTTAVPPTPVWRASMESQMNNLSAQISAFMSMHQSMMGSYQVGPPIGQLILTLLVQPRSTSPAPQSKQLSPQQKLTTPI